MRNPHHWSVTVAGFIGSGLLCALVAGVLAITLAESLWLDELHTSWSIAGGSWRQVADRAAAGNQTPLYFWIAAAVVQTLGDSTDWIVRAPSVVAWLAAMGLAVWVLLRERGTGEAPDGSRGPLFWVGVLGWIAVDRLHWFYATEARPYALVQLVTLAGWFCLAELQRELQSELQVRRGGKVFWLVGGWVVLAVVSVYLHLTALLPVGCQWLVGVAVLLSRSRQRLPEQVVAPERIKAKLLYVWLAAAVGVAVACLPVLSVAKPVWQRRAQWASFASDVSLANGLAMFPVVAVLAPVLGAVVMGALLSRFGRGRVVESVTARAADAAAVDRWGNRWLWWAALLGPWLLAWLITALEIAPMFHRRFVIASALPLVIVGALELMRVRRAWLRGLALVTVAGAIAFSQGSVGIWRQGYLVGTLRGEDWRGAAGWLSDRVRPGERVLCSSGLIEAVDVQLPLDRELAEYLAFPLGGAYRVRVLDDGADESAVPIVALAADAGLWAEQVGEQRAGQVAQQTPEQVVAPERCWLVYRGAKGRLLEKVEVFAAGRRKRGGEVRLVEVKGFGRVWVAELMVDG